MGNAVPAPTTVSISCKAFLTEAGEVALLKYYYSDT